MDIKQLNEELKQMLEYTMDDAAKETDMLVKEAVKEHRGIVDFEKQNPKDKIEVTVADLYSLLSFAVNKAKIFGMKSVMDDKHESR